jgi:hypothetical protein
MSRGGKRPGAGRPPKLHPVIRWRIALDCEEAHRKIVKANRDTASIRPRAIAIRKERDEILRRTQAKENLTDGVWSAYRRAGLHDDADRHLKKWQESPTAQERQAAIETASRKLDALGRYQPGKTSRPKNARNAIIEDVAKKYKTTPRLVRECWVEGRRRLQRLQADLADYESDPNNAWSDDDF